MDFYLEKVIERESGDRAGASRGGWVTGLPCPRAAIIKKMTRKQQKYNTHQDDSPTKIKVSGLLFYKNTFTGEKKKIF